MRHDDRRRHTYTRGAWGASWGQRACMRYATALAFARSGWSALHNDRRHQHQHGRHDIYIYIYICILCICIYVCMYNIPVPCTPRNVRAVMWLCAKRQRGTCLRTDTHSHGVRLPTQTTRHREHGTYLSQRRVEAIQSVRCTLRIHQVPPLGVLLVDCHVL